MGVGKGYSRNFHPNRCFFHLLPPGAGPSERPHQIDVPQLKAVFFVRDFDSNAPDDDRPEQESQPGTGRPLEVSFLTLSHARSEDKLEEHLELLRCHYNFVRPHGALQFGREVRTPAMQAGLATQRLTFREILVGQPPSLISINPHRRDRVRRAGPVTDCPGRGRACGRLSNS